MGESGVGAGAASTPPALKKTRDVLAELKVGQLSVKDTSLPPAAPSPKSEGEGDITYEEALKRKEAKELEQEKLLCSLAKCVPFRLRLFLF